MNPPDAPAERPREADRADAIRARIEAAQSAATPLAIVGGGTKAFYGRTCAGEPLAVAEHRGVVNYQPSELVLTARCGTPLHELEALLAEHGQMLPFEPPHFGPGATIGGAVASGLSGPRRPYAGAARDLVLGVKLVNGKGEILHFGGEVMKNVAGYDIARLMAGSLGTLAVLLEVSLKVLPAPAREETLVFELDAASAIDKMNALAGKPYPVSAAGHHDGVLRVRLSGSERGVASARAKLGGEATEDAQFWSALREQTHPFFAGEAPLWRLSVSPAAPPIELPRAAGSGAEAGACLIDWGGAQRWYRTEADADTVRKAALRARGHALLFRHGERDGEVFHPLPDALMRLHRRLKAAFDPAGIFNPGRMYAGL